MVANGRVRLPAEEMHGRSRHGTQTPLVLTRTNDDQASPRGVASGNRQVEAPVRSEGGHGQVIVLAGQGRRRVELRVHGWVNDFAVPAIRFPDALLDSAAIRNKVRHPRGGAAIPVRRAPSSRSRSRALSPVLGWKYAVRMCQAYRMGVKQ